MFFSLENKPNKTQNKGAIVIILMLNNDWRK